MVPMKKVVVVNGSPRADRGNTGRILKPFIEGMRDARAEVRLLYPKRMNIKPCAGTLSCWDRHPGTCGHRDGMQSAYPLLRQAEILVFATPVYIPLPGEMQNFLNRLCPLIDPVLERRKGRTRARFRQDVRIERIALVSTGGWYEKGNFDTVLKVAKEFAETTSVKFAGALLRPHAQYLRQGDPKAEEVFEAAREAGRELVIRGRMPKRLSDAVGRPLIHEEDY
jgi:multimeric flavodoxin WrbA